MQHKSIWVVIIQGVLMASIIIAPMLTGYRFSAPQDVWDWIGTIVSILGLLLIIASIYVLRKSFTIHPNLKHGTKLVTEFPFSISRNPIYLGLLIISFSWSLLQRSPLAALLALLLLIILNYKVKIEESNLQLIFGEKYLSYKNSVRRFL